MGWGVDIKPSFIYFFKEKMKEKKGIDNSMKKNKFNKIKNEYKE